MTQKLQLHFYFQKQFHKLIVFIVDILSTAECLFTETSTFRHHLSRKYFNRLTLVLVSYKCSLLVLIEIYRVIIVITPCIPDFNEWYTIIIMAHLPFTILSALYSLTPYPSNKQSTKLTCQMIYYSTTITTSSTQHSHQQQHPAQQH